MAISIKKLNCLFLTIDIDFNEAMFNTRAFLKDIGETRKKSFPRIFPLSFGSKNKTKKEHSHMLVVLDKDESRINISFRQGENHDEDVRPPYLEGCVSWIASFFNDSVPDANITALFEFGGKYEPLIDLNYPLLVGGVHLKDAKVTGYDIEVPNGSKSFRINIMSRGDNIGIIYTANEKIDLASFNYQDYALNLSEITNSLIKLRGE